MRFLIDHLTPAEQFKIQEKNHREMVQFVKENPIISGIEMNGTEYKSLKNKKKEKNNENRN